MGEHAAFLHEGGRYERHDYSERRAGALVGLNRRTFRRSVPADADNEVRQRLRELAQALPRFGSPRLHVLLRREGLVKNPKRTERLYRVPDRADQSWAMDFVCDALVNGRRMRMLTIIDAWNRECPRIEVDFSLTGPRVARVPQQLRQQGRRPQRMQVDNGSEFISKALDASAHEQGVRAKSTFQ